MTDADLKVHHLIDYDSKTWNEPFLRELVCIEDVSRILKLKPCRLGRPDGYSWSFTKSGAYTVKAGYEVINERRRSQMERPIVEPSVTHLKKEVWKLKTTRKIKHFLWQSLAGFVTAASRLCDRHCATDRACLRCGAEEETINHILFECLPALQCWALSDIPTFPGVFPCSALFTNFDHLLWRAKEQGVPKETLEPFPWILSYIWKGRNNFLFNGVDPSPVDTLHLALAEANSWKIAQSIPRIEDELIPEGHEEDRGSIEQQEGSGLRCQVDASWVHEGRKSGLGFVLTEREKIILVGMKNCSDLMSPLRAEAEGLVWAMKMMLEKGYVSVHIETDCAQLLKLIQSFGEWPVMAESIEDIKVLSKKFLQFSISYLPRGKNHRADGLAKAARARSDCFSITFVETPVWLAHVARLLE